MAKKKKKPVRALRNEDVTGITEDKQDQIAKETGTGPRDTAAESFYEEQGRQAGSTEPSSHEGRRKGDGQP